MDRFWMVIRAGDNSWTKVRHNTLKEASEEADRLCRLEHVDFVILESITFCHLPEGALEWTALW